MSQRTTIIWSATPTPFGADGTLDMASLERVLEQHRRLGVTGLFLAGTCGEGPFMPADQAVELVRAVKRCGGAEFHVAAQVTDMSAARVRVNIRRMQDAGADSVVLAAPWGSSFCNAGYLRRYFFEPIATAELPVGIYVHKQPAGSALNLRLWTEIMAHPKVRMVKDSSVSPEYAAAFLGVKEKNPELVLLTGGEFDVLGALSAGYDGALLGTGILIGGMIRCAAEAVAAGDPALAETWQQRSNRFLWDLFGRDCSIWLGGLKYALRRLGVFSTEFMHLHYELSEADKMRIDAALEREMTLIRPQCGA